MCEVGPNMVLFELPLRYQFRDRHSKSIRTDDRALAGVVDEQCSEAVQQFLTRDAKSVLWWRAGVCVAAQHMLLVRHPSAIRESNQQEPAHFFRDQEIDWVVAGALDSRGVSRLCRSCAGCFVAAAPAQHGQRSRPVRLARRETSP